MLQGYTYSVFNLVYETNVASCRIWDALGFKRIGRVKGCGRLKSHSFPVDAIIYGRELDAASQDDFVTEERFDKIKYYLKHQKYPEGADRAEKSRLRSAATHYRLAIESHDDGSEPEEKLFLKDKEVISDPQKQYEIARDVHLISHGGINKTTASIAEKFHWVRIKDTATVAIKNCPQCCDPVKNTASTMGQKDVGSHFEQTSTLISSAQQPALLMVDHSQNLQQVNPNSIDSGNTIASTTHEYSSETMVPVDPRILSMQEYDVPMLDRSSEVQHEREGGNAVLSFGES
jgi:hypothetical protein